MPVFGAYETVGQPSPTPFGPVYKAKKTGGASTDFIIKTFSPLGVDAHELKRHPDVKRFLGSAQLQQQVAAANSKHWAPIFEMGISQEGAYYVSTLYPTSASRLIKGKAKLSGDDFYELSTAVLAGLVELKQACRRSHGNLTANTVLLPRMDASGYGQAALAEPLSSDSTKSASEQGDLAALGRVLYELVMYKPYNVAGAWPIPETPDWARLGKRGKEWRAFCNKLLSTEPADALTLESAQAELEKLKPKKAPVPIWAIAAAVFVLLIGGGIIAYIKTRPDPHFQEKWTTYTEAYNEWFKVFADSEWRRNLPPEYENLFNKVGQNAKLTLRELNSNSDQAPQTREEQRLTGKAIEVATLMQEQLLQYIDPKAPRPAELDATSVKTRLKERISGVIETYQQRKWKNAAEALVAQLHDFDSTDSKEERKYYSRLTGLLSRLSQLKKIENDWQPIEARAQAVVESGDPILIHLPELFAHKVDVKDLDEALGKNILELNLELGSAEWSRFFDFVQKDWKDITKDPKTLADFRNASEQYKRFARDKPELEWIHLSTWMKEAGDYTSLTIPNPAFDSKLMDGVKDLRDQLGGLAPLANQVGEAERNRVARLTTALEGLSTQLKDLQQNKRWSKGNQREVEAAAKAISGSVDELASNVRVMKDDLKNKSVANAREFIDKIDKMRFADPLQFRWNDFKRELGWGNPQKMKDLEDASKRAELNRRSDAVANALRDIETRLPERLNLTVETRNRGWGPELVTLLAPLETRQRSKSMEVEARLIKFDQLLGNAAQPQAQHEQYREWCTRARAFVLQVDELEDRLNAGYGLILGAGEKIAPATALVEKLKADQEFWPELSAALKPLLGRYQDLKKLETESQISTLVRMVQESKDAAMAVDAWRRLGQLDSWPRTGQDLDIEKNALKHIPQVIKSGAQYSQAAIALGNQRAEDLDNEFTQQWPRRWGKFISMRRGSQAELEQALPVALTRAAEFGVPDWQKLETPLPAEVRWNIFVMRSRALIADLATKVEDKDAQIKVKQVIDLLPTGNDVGADVAELSAKLRKLADAQGGAAAVEIDAGPGSKEAQKLVRWEKSEENGVVTFTWKEKGHQLSFICLNGAKLPNGGNAPPYYLSTTEVTLALFAEVMNALGPDGTADKLGLPLSGDRQRGIKGPQLWRRTGKGGIEPGTIWLRSHPLAFDDYPATLPGGFDQAQQVTPAREIRLREQMPMQHVPPAAALYIAAQLGCRFPTYSEWRVAATAHGINPPEWPNLRDLTWSREFGYIMGLRPSMGTQAQAPDSGSIKTTANLENTDAKATVWNAQTLAAAGLGAIPAGVDDHYLWMRPVGNGKSFSDLYGNVAELTFDDPESFEKLSDKSLDGIRQFLDQRAAQLAVVGGSFQSAPELGVDRQQLSDMNSGYADMGFRLAFVAEPAAIVDQLRELMKKVVYVTAASPTTVPAN